MKPTLRIFYNDHRDKVGVAFADERGVLIGSVRMSKEVWERFAARMDWLPPGQELGDIMVVRCQPEEDPAIMAALSVPIPREVL